jgi:trigger factor
LAEAEGNKRSLEISVAAEEVEQETNRVVETLKGQVKIPGFRPGKVPDGMIRSRYASEIRQDVLEALVPKALKSKVEDEGLDIVGSPNIKDIQFEKGEPLSFTAEVEIVPEFELEEYRGLEVEYEEPEVTEEDVDKRMEGLQQQKAEYINVDPRPVEDGDFAVVSLKSVGGLEGEPIENDEMMLHVGDSETMADFSKNLTGMEPGEEKEIEVTYPEDYGQERLAGKAITFHVNLKVIRKKEVPGLDDDFAQDLGDYKDLAELRDAMKSGMQAEQQFMAQQEAKNSAIDQLVDMHAFEPPEAFIEGQIETNIRTRLEEMMAQGIDPRKMEIDWEKVKESQRERSIRDVKASMILDRIGECENIEVTQDEVDRQVDRLATQRQEPVAAVRKDLEESDEIRRVASRIRTEKTLNLLFEQSRKIAKKEKKEEKEEE